MTEERKIYGSYYNAAPPTGNPKKKYGSGGKGYVFMVKEGNPNNECTACTGAVAVAVEITPRAQIHSTGLCVSCFEDFRNILNKVNLEEVNYNQLVKLTKNLG